MKLSGSKPSFVGRFYFSDYRQLRESVSGVKHDAPVMQHDAPVMHTHAHTVSYKTPNVVPCAVQQKLVVYLLYTY